MSAALTLAPPAPSALLRRQVPAVQAVPDPRTVITVEGDLLDDAQMRIEGATQRPLIELRISQGARDFPFRAVWAGFGEGFDAQATAQRQAERLTRGRRVVVRGEGLHTTFVRGDRFHQIALVASVQVLEGGAA